MVIKCSFISARSCRFQDTSDIIDILQKHYQNVPAQCYKNCTLDDTLVETCVPQVCV